jgi:AraC-like DNA-binding protein
MPASEPDPLPGFNHPELQAIIDRHAPAEGDNATAVPGLRLFRYTRPTYRVKAVYEQSICVAAQGSKEVMLRNKIFTFDPHYYLLVSVCLPVAAQIIEASPQRPHLSLSINLDHGVIFEMLADEDIALPPPGRELCGIAAGLLEPSLLETVTRFIRLLDTPQHIPALGPLILREIFYLLLVGSAGAQLKQIVLEHGHVHRVVSIIQRIRRDYSQTLRIEVLAKEVGMSVSSLHHQFKAVTDMSPLQYQKQMRLHEARRLMLGEDLDAASASFRVGYESPSQFSREYRRMFGAPPRQDISKLRANL